VVGAAPSAGAGRDPLPPPGGDRPEIADLACVATHLVVDGDPHGADAAQVMRRIDEALDSVLAAVERRL